MIVLDEIALDKASEKAIEPLEEDEEVVVLMPANEFVIAHGPKRTVLFWLCRDVGTTVKISGFLEGELLGGFVCHQLSPRCWAVRVPSAQSTILPMCPPIHCI